MKGSYEVKTALEGGNTVPRAVYAVPALEGLGKWHFATGITFKVGSLVPGGSGDVFGARPWSLDEDNRR